MQERDWMLVAVMSQRGKLATELKPKSRTQPFNEQEQDVSFRERRQNCGYKCGDIVMERWETALFCCISFPSP
jgi:hypothetical protein